MRQDLFRFNINNNQIVTFSSKDHREPAAAQASSSTPEISNEEKLKIINETIQNLSRGTISIQDALKTLEEIGIIPQVSETNGKKIYKFEFNGKEYTFSHTEKRNPAIIAPIQERGYDFTQIQLSRENVMIDKIIGGRLSSDLFVVLNNKVPFNSLNELYSKLKNKELDNDVSKETIEQYLNQYFNLLKKELKDSYSENYLNSIIDFARTKVDIEAPYNAAKILNEFKKILDELTKETKVSKKDISLKTLNNFAKSKKPQEQYLASIFLKKFEELGLTDDEKEAFLSRIISRVRYRKFDNDKLLKNIDTNNNKNWLEELLDIANQEFSKIKVVDRNATTVNIDMLFGNNNQYDAKELLANMNNMLLSDDGGVRKFAALIQKAFDILGSRDYEDRIEATEWIIKYINQRLGILTTNPISLTKEAIEKLNNNNIFQELTNIIESKGLYNNYMLSDVDGDIEHFNQGSTGDCWLLASIIAMNQSELGRQIIKDSIQWNNDNSSVTVTFRGLGISYVISAEEVVEAIEAGTAYSYGDHDVLILEIATEKLRRDIAAGKIKLPHGGVYSDISENDNGSNGSGITGGYTDQMLYFLTGNTSNDIATPNYNVDTYLSKSQITNYCLNLLNDFQKGNVVLTFSIQKNVHEFTTIDGEHISIDLGNGGHALTIVGMTQNTVTIVNPWNSSAEFTLTWDEFAKFGINRIISTNIQSKNNICKIDGQEVDIHKVLKSKEATFISLSTDSRGFANASGMAMDKIRSILTSLKYAFPNCNMDKLNKAYETTLNYYQAAFNSAGNNIIDNNGAVGKPFTYYNASKGRTETSSDQSNMRSAWNSRDVKNPHRIAEKANVNGTGLYIGHDKEAGNGHNNDKFNIFIDLKTVINKFLSFLN